VDDECRHVYALHVDTDLPVAVDCGHLREPALHRCRRIEPRGDPPVVFLRMVVDPTRCERRLVGHANCLVPGQLGGPHPDVDRVGRRRLVLRPAGAGAGEHERADEVRPASGEHERDVAAHGVPIDIRPVESTRVEH